MPNVPRQRRLSLGLPPSRLEALCRGAGFTRFTVHDAADPANLYYEVRP